MADISHVLDEADPDTMNQCLKDFGIIWAMLEREFVEILNSPSLQDELRSPDRRGDWALWSKFAKRAIINASPNKAMSRQYFDTFTRHSMHKLHSTVSLGIAELIRTVAEIGMYLSKNIIAPYIDGDEGRMVNSSVRFELDRSVGQTWYIRATRANLLEEI